MATKIQSVANGTFGVSLDLSVSALGGGNVVVVSGWCQEARTLTIGATGVTFATVEGAVSNSGAGDIRIYQWVGVIDTPGATTITITEGSGAVIHGVMQEWSGPTGVVDKHTTGETTPAGTSHNVTAGVLTTTADELLVASIGQTGGMGIFTAGGGYTAEAASNNVIMMYKVVSATGTYDAPSTSSNSDSSVTILGTFPLSGGGGITLTRLERGTRGVLRGMSGGRILS